MGRVYLAAGQSYLVCPRLLELDKRHGEHNCGLKYPLPLDHEHDPECGCFIDLEGHSTVLLAWAPGCSVIEPDHPDLTCRCGKLLVHSDLLHPWRGEHISEVAESAPAQTAPVVDADVGRAVGSDLD